MISHTKSPTAPQVQSSEHHACANKPHTDQLTRIRDGSSSTQRDQRADSLSDTQSQINIISIRRKKKREEKISINTTLSLVICESTLFFFPT